MSRRDLPGAPPSPPSPLRTTGETPRVEDVPPQTFGDESAWHAEVYEKDVASSNPGLTRAMAELKKRFGRQ